MSWVLTPIKNAACSASPLGVKVADNAKLGPPLIMSIIVSKTKPTLDKVSVVV